MGFVMPLRDRFHAPLADFASWEELHDLWLGLMAVPSSSGRCVVIVDPVTTRSANLYAELATRLGAKPPATAGASLYAVCCRPRMVGARYRIESWEHTLAVGQTLPTLPLWISETQYVPLELDQTYEDTCRGLRIP